MTKLLAAAVLALVATLAQARDWMRLDSEHFTLYTRIDDSVSRQYLKQLEAFRWLALKLLGAGEGGARAKSRFEIYLLPGRMSLHALYPEMDYNVAGVYSRCSEGAVAFGADVAEVDRRQDLTLMVLQHEYAHHLMSQYAAISYPAWYVEGFAEFMSTAVYEDGRITLGAASPMRMTTLNRGGFLPFADLLGWLGKPIKQRSRSEIDSFYAQSWLLTHYMLSDDARAKKLAAYFERIGAGEDPVAAFEPAFGLRIDEMNELLSRYIRAAAMLKLPTAGMAVPTLRAAELGAQSQEWIAQAAMLRACRTPERGRELLQTLRDAAAHEKGAIEPGLRLALARGEMLFGDAKVAVALPAEDFGTDEQRAEAHYLRGRAWMRQAQSAAGDEQAAAYDEARRALFQAYRLRKDDAPTLYHLALVLSRGGDSGNALNAARGARLLVPTIGDYAALEAGLDLAAGDRERAARALMPLASDPHDAERAARVREAIRAIRDGKSAQEVSALMNSPTRKAVE
jgi:hypothetical protein